ncbi:phage tail protein [Magnetospirillum aberrantis]|uniref:Phage tail protein n=1 Tax=Magnetospirillum aberrantis SpK TaxID=908842 RepID=A0A7C9UX25_9PROT|nr:tail fiber protein [Magnetospirillum aberrantis]NFV78831.1 phage tail protein [Magnetospirillum aberrantis SpK]
MKTKHALFSASVLAAVATLTLGGRPAAACGTEAYIGQICIVAGSFCPRGTVETNGQLLPLSDNEALFALIGCTYGGDCRTTMGVPDLRGRAPTGYGQGPGLTEYSVGERYGLESVTQTIAMMAPHNHTATFTPDGSGGGSSGTAAQVLVSTDPGDTNSPTGGKYLSAASSSGVKIYNSGTNASALTPLSGVSGGGGSGGGGTVTVDPTGGTPNGTVTPIPTVPPSIAMRYCMVTVGLYPSRP